MKNVIIGVMGSGNEATGKDIKNAFILGKLIAENSYILLTGGRNAGVMDAASKGAKEKNGLTIGILPSSNKKELSKYVDIPIITGMGSARNNINVLSSNVLIAVGIGPGTASEIALALKAKKDVILLNPDKETVSFFKNMGKNFIHTAKNPEESLHIAKKILGD